MNILDGWIVVRSMTGKWKTTTYRIAIICFFPKKNCLHIFPRLFLCLYPSAPIPAPEPDEDWSPGISPVRSPCSTGQMVLISEEDTDNNGAPYAVGPLPGPGVCASAPSSAERKPSMGGRKASVPLILNSSRVSSRRPSYNYADCSSLVASPKHVDVLGTTNEESDSPTLRSQICSVIFVLLSLTAGTHMLLLNWVISTVPAQMEVGFFFKVVVRLRMIERLVPQDFFERGPAVWFCFCVLMDTEFGRGN